MSVVAAAVIGSAVVGGVAANKASKAQASAASRASSDQLQAQREANDLQREMYEQNRTDLAPWREAGVGTLAQLTAGLQPGGEFNRSFTMADYQADPGYAFRQSEGQKAIDNSAAARGSALSGATLKALTRFGQDTASTEYQNAYNRWNNDMSTRFNRLSGVAGTGQQATTTLGNMGQTTAGNIAQGTVNTANNVANNTLQAGNARASGYVGTANALSGAANNYLTLSMLGSGNSAARAAGAGSTYSGTPLSYYG